VNSTFVPFSSSPIVLVFLLVVLPAGGRGGGRGGGTIDVETGESGFEEDGSGASKAGDGGGAGGRGREGGRGGAGVLIGVEEEGEAFGGCAREGLGGREGREGGGRRGRSGELGDGVEEAVDVERDAARGSVIDHEVDRLFPCPSLLSRRRRRGR